MRSRDNGGASNVELHIPEDVARILGKNPDREALEAILLHLIRSGRVSVGWAGARLGLDRQQAIQWYTSHGYPYPDYTAEDFEEDLRHANRFPRQPGG
jgi:predicted HTH domain antitoxin